MGKGERRGRGRRAGRRAGHRHIGRNLATRHHRHIGRGHTHFTAVILLIFAIIVCVSAVILIVKSETLVGSCLLVGGFIIIAGGVAYIHVMRKISTASSSLTVTQTSNLPGDDVTVTIYNPPSTTTAVYPGTEVQPSTNPSFPPYSYPQTGFSPNMYSERTGTETYGIYSDRPPERSGNNYESQPASSQQHDPFAPPLYESYDNSQPVSPSGGPPSYDQAVHMQTPMSVQSTKDTNHSPLQSSTGETNLP